MQAAGSIAQTAPQRMHVGHCSSTHSCLWESSNAHCITTPVFAVLSFDTSKRLMLKIASVLQVPISQAVEQPWWFLQSKVGREHFPGQEQFCPDVPQQQRCSTPGWRTLSATENIQAHHSSKVDSY